MFEIASDFPSLYRIFLTFDKNMVITDGFSI